MLLLFYVINKDMNYQQNKLVLLNDLLFKFFVHILNFTSIIVKINLGKIEEFIENIDYWMDSY